MFLGNNGVATFRSQRFRRISETCCSTIVLPPLEWDFPVYNIHKIIGQRIRNFVANGNMLVLTGGILSIEFLNAYFFYNIDLADGNYSPGPYYRLDDVPVCLKAAAMVLPQKGIAVTAVKKQSLPSGTQVLWGTPRSSPVFMIKFCEAQSPNEGMPPIKVGLSCSALLPAFVSLSHSLSLSFFLSHSLSLSFSLSHSALFSFSLFLARRRRGLRKRR